MAMILWNYTIILKKGAIMKKYILISNQMLSLYRTKHAITNRIQGFLVL